MGDVERSFIPWSGVEYSRMRLIVGDLLLSLGVVMMADEEGGWSFTWR